MSAQNARIVGRVERAPLSFDDDAVSAPKDVEVIIDELIGPDAHLTAGERERWRDVLLEAVSGAPAEPGGAEAALVEAIREATKTVTIKRVGGGLSGYIIIPGMASLCHAGDFDDVSGEAAKHILLDVLTILAPRAPVDRTPPPAAASTPAVVEAQRALMEALREIERHCPCGARPESMSTHPHVGGCPVQRALDLASGAAPSGDETPR